MNKDKIQLINFNNNTWEYFKEYIDVIGDFLSTHENTPQISNLMALAIRLIVSELVLKPDIYDKYPKTIFSDEDFVDMMIDSMECKSPNPNDVDANERYVNEMRRIMWGHIKVHYPRIEEILVMLGEEHEGNILVESDGDIFVACLMIVWVESILRKRETQLLERSYFDV